MSASTIHAKVEHISYTMGTRALSVYTHSHSGLRPSSLCVYIRQNTRALGMTITYI